MKTVTKKLTIWGGYHNQMRPITILIPRDFDMEYYGLSGLFDWDCKAISERTKNRVRKHMCGNSDCICGMNHGWKYEVKK